MDKEKQYEKMYRALMDYENRAHLRNKHRIRVGITCLVFVPIAFLILMFLTDSSKPLFLMLWIISLYGIAVYLILVEYADHKLQQKLAQFRGEEEVEVKALIGEHMENVEETLRNVKDKAEHFLMLSAGEEAEEVLDLNEIVPDVKEPELPEDLSEKIEEAAELPEDLPEQTEEEAEQPEDLPEETKEETEQSEDLPEETEEAEQPEDLPEEAEEEAEQSEKTEEETDEKHS